MSITAACIYQVQFSPEIHVECAMCFAYNVIMLRVNRYRLVFDVVVALFLKLDLILSANLNFIYNDYGHYCINELYNELNNLYIMYALLICDVHSSVTEC